MNREEIIESSQWLDSLEFFQINKQETLTEYVNRLDLELVEILLQAGANPNYNSDSEYKQVNDGFLHDLAHEYYSVHDTKGELILKCVELLLKHGANPNQAGDCNRTPIQRFDFSSEYTKPFVDLLLKYGANPKGNEIY